MTKIVLSSLVAMSATVPLFSAPSWTSTMWNGERAFALETPSWRAVVSDDRARLVHFGAAGSEKSLVFAPRTKNEPIGWGGHRVWLGPQTKWGPIWPPPNAWEKNAAKNALVEGARLELEIPEAGDGWPHLTRVYELTGGRLACRVLVAAGAKREAQIVQIFQTPPPSELVLRVQSSTAFPLGFALVPPTGGRDHAIAAAELPAQAIAVTGGLKLQQTDRAEKLGFPPQEIVAHFGTQALHVARSVPLGSEAGAPDAGFYTQVYVGEARTPVIELEQLSPLFKAGEAAEFTVVLDLAAQ